MRSQIIFNRPNDTTTYGGYEYINKTGSTIPFWVQASNLDKINRVLWKNLMVKTNMTSVPSGLTYLRLQFYNKLPIFNCTDNLPVANQLSAIESYMGYVDTPNLSANWGFVAAWKNGIEMILDLASDNPSFPGQKGVWFTLTTIGGFIPVANTKFVIYLGFVGIE